MNVLVLGSGGREHAIAWKLAQSSQLENLYIAPGNPGTASLGVNVALSLTDFDGIASFALENNVQIVVVGPEDPLVNGIHDYFEDKEELSGITIIGPKKEGAIIEGSKDFSKAFMKKYNIPTAKYSSFSEENLESGYAYLEKMSPPYVLKADGLAAGKGVLILDDLNQAKSELRKMVAEKKFGEASSTVVIEQFLAGIEVSVFVITDGKSYKILPEAKDYKRIGEADTGLNTGGMGAISPVPFANRDFMDKVDNQVIIPTIKGLRAEGIDYSGFIFFGLISVKGDPYVIEYNCRLGDPETEVVMPRLKSDLLELFDGIATGTLSERDVQIDPRTASTVMMVSGGYPEDYEKGKVIKGLHAIEDSIVFHAGTKDDSGLIKTNGGRVLAVTSYGKDIETALKISYESAHKIQFENRYFRKDLGFDLIKKNQKT
ncbi:MAG: phosphoribosylamine--glycine ligase [Crocinitomicaceae bacterium]|jgi:phosphoribosylamine--glycine ligase|nr:phosphoribosylamine--glycine ligase [Crocinitomicaceae bacterium]MBT5401967.1 phosphoribosylamine--glycine ligase [Crocinitomicaceae bacterium]